VAWAWACTRWSATLAAGCRLLGALCFCASQQSALEPPCRSAQAPVSPTLPAMLGLALATPPWPLPGPDPDPGLQAACSASYGLAWQPPLLFAPPPLPPAGSLLRFLRALHLEAGWPLEEALPLLTANPALVLKLPRKGRICLGCDADILLFDVSGGLGACRLTFRCACRGVVGGA